VTSEEMNAFRIFERKIVRRICGPIIEGERWRIGKIRRQRIY
jgi:hypothetical protein